MTKTETATATLEELEQAARQSGQEVKEAQDRIDQRSSRIAQLRSERLRLAVEQPAMFDQEGRAKRGTEAAKLDAELESVRDTDYTTVLAAAEERAQRARRAVNDHVITNATKLAEEMRPEAEGVVEDIEAALRAVVSSVDRYFAVQRRAMDLLRPVQGLDGQDVPNADHIAKLQRIARQALGEGFPLPLSRSLAPQDGYPSPKVQTPDGGWVKPQNLI